MPKLKFLFKSLAAITALMILPSPVAHGADTDFTKFWTLDDMYSQGISKDQVLLTYSENGAHIGSSSYIETLDSKTNAGISLCEQIGQAPCDVASLLAKKVNIYAPVVMPLCESETSGDCVESLALTTSEGERVVGEFIRMVSGATYGANPELSFPQTGKQLLFRVPGVTHMGGTDTYAVEYTQTLEWVGKKTPYYRDLKVAVVPYVETQSATAKTQILRPGKTPMGKGDFTLDPWNYPGGSIWMEAGLLGKIANFSEGVSAQVTIRANKQFGGWFRGRLSNAEFETAQISQAQQKISISGESVEIPRIAGLVNEEQYKKYTTQPFFFYENHKGGGVGGDVSDPDGIFVWLNAIRAVSDDTARGVNRSWMFATVPVWRKVGCYKASGVQGLIATNAAVYAGGAPEYANGFLNYRVGGLHFLPDGTEAIGTYDLVMRSDIARCLYGFSKAPISGTVTVTGEGEQKIATTIVSEKNGWLKLSANGFTFSTKTIKVKLSQKKSTITCVSKSQPSNTRKVTAYAPKCPSGFVKK